MKKHAARGVRFSITTIMALVLICAVVLGVVRQYFVTHARKHAAAIEVVSQWGYVHTRPMRFGWAVGTDKAEELASLDLPGASITDAELSPLLALGTLEGINVPHTPITDAGMEAVGANRSLRSLNLSYTHITDMTLQHLAMLRELAYLDVEGCPIADAGIAHLRELPLHWLNLRKTRISDDAMAVIGSMRGLSFLCLDDTAVTSSGLRHLKSLQSLEILRLSGIQVQGALHVLRDHQSLGLLSISHSNIDNRDLLQVMPLNQLLELDVSHTNVSLEGLMIIKEGCPRLKMLNVASANIGPVEIEFLSQWQELKILKISKNAAPEATLQQLVNSLSTTRVIILEQGPQKEPPSSKRPYAV